MLQEYFTNRSLGQYADGQGLMEPLKTSYAECFALNPDAGLLQHVM